MNAHIATLQLLLELGNPPESVQLPVPLREVAQKFDITDYGKLQDSFFQELQHNSVGEEGLLAFSFLARSFSIFQILSSEDLSSLLDVIEQKIASPRAGLNQKFWVGVHHILGSVSDRIRRQSTLESFEDAVGNVNWGELASDPAWMSTISGLIGLAYLREEEDQAGKAPLWLDQAIKTGTQSQTLVYHYARIRYALDRNLSGEEAEIDLSSLQTSKDSGSIGKAYRLAELEMKIRLMYHQLGSYTKDQYAEAVQQIIRLDQECRDLDEMSSCSVVVFETLLGKLYCKVAAIPSEPAEVEAQITRATQYFERALTVATELAFPLVTAGLKAERIQATLEANAPVTEKEVREPVAIYKKLQNFSAYAEQLTQQATYLAGQEQWAKLSDVVFEILKFAGKQQGAARYYLLLSGLRMGNHHMKQELLKPGVSWIVGKLDEYFSFYEAAIQEILELESMDAIGGQMFEEFRKLFSSFRPLIDFNINVYYRYQYQSVNMLTLSLKLQDDQRGQEIAKELTALFDHQNNPMNIVKADWEDFKDVPNSVRNRTLNKCIDISKGDLPLAAEQLDFSYRNLRSYITFKEVNRLGFFLDQSTTTNRQLEQGIRFMFHDLYKKGTIFEVVFDMPKFLVDHVNSGFYSQDLEEALDIKGTTAKKYIKIMASIGMIYQEKIPGRKHFYRVRKDEIMKRLGSDQATLIES